MRDDPELPEAVVIPFGFVAWIIQVFLTNHSPATVIEAVASSLARAVTYLWYERRLTFRRAPRLTERHA
jgi:hypothetical protein